MFLNDVLQIVELKLYIQGKTRGLSRYIKKIQINGDSSNEQKEEELEFGIQRIVKIIIFLYL